MTLKSSAKSTSKKQKLFHPASRKADQIVRSQLRRNKLTTALAQRERKQNYQFDLYHLFFASIPQEGTLTLDDLHSLVRDVWLTRHDTELQHERANRRKGRPKSVKELKLEEVKLREAEDYRTGMDVPDLTDGETVQLFRRWDQKELAFIRLLPFVRIFHDESQAFVPSIVSPVNETIDETYM